jgi:DNA-binding SARP family transcriptional activator
VQIQQAHPERAVAIAREALKRHPEDARLQALLGTLLIRQMGAKVGSPEYAEAEEHARRAVRLDPQRASAHELLAEVESEKGNLRDSISQWKASLALEPGDQTAMYHLMRALRQSGDRAGSDALVQELANVHQQTRDEESKRKRFQIKLSQQVP